MDPSLKLILSSAGVLSGTVAAGATAGRDPFTVQVTDSLKKTATANFTLTVK